MTEYGRGRGVFMATESRFVPTGPSAAEQTFPVLSAAQLQRIAAHGKRREMQVGEVMLKAGDPLSRSYVVLSGRIDLYRQSPAGLEFVTSITPGQFSGEVSLLSGRRALVTAIVKEAGELIEVGRDELLKLVQTDSELSDIIMRAFILRRVSLIAFGIS